MSDASHVIGGHKANIHNPNTSKESKEHSMEILEKEFGVNGGEIEQEYSSEKNPQNVVAGLKATINNPSVSEKTTKSAKERLKEMGEGSSSGQDDHGPKNPHNAAGGLKA